MIRAPLCMAANSTSTPFCCTLTGPESLTGGILRLPMGKGMTKDRVKRCLSLREITETLIEPSRPPSMTSRRSMWVGEKMIYRSASVIRRAGPHTLEAS